MLSFLALSFEALIFSFAALCYLCPLLPSHRALRTRQAANEKTQASNDKNARKNKHCYIPFIIEPQFNIMFSIVIPK